MGHPSEKKNGELVAIVLEACELLRQYRNLQQLVLEIFVDETTDEGSRFADGLGHSFYLASKEDELEEAQVLAALVNSYLSCRDALTDDAVRRLRNATPQPARLHCARGHQPLEVTWPSYFEAVWYFAVGLASYTYGGQCMIAREHDVVVTRFPDRDTPEWSADSISDETINRVVASEWDRIRRSPGLSGLIDCHRTRMELLKEVQRATGEYPNEGPDLELPKSRTTKLRPTTRRVIQLLQKGSNYDQICAQTAMGVDNVRKIASRYPELWKS